METEEKKAQREIFCTFISMKKRGWSTHRICLLVYVAILFAPGMTVARSTSCLPPFSVQHSISQPLCIGDSVSLEVDSFPNVTYQWFRNGAVVPGASGFNLITSVDGLYNVLLTDTISQCSDSLVQGVLLDFGSIPVAKINPVDSASICEGESFVFNAAGIGIVAYQWNVGATQSDLSVSQSGIYQVVVFGPTGCSDTASASLLVFDSPKPFAGEDASFCSGDSVWLTVSPSFMHYQWNTGAEDSTILVDRGGTYIVEVHDSNACSGFDTVVVQEHVLPIVDLGSGGSICPDESITLDGGEGFETYLWSGGQSSRFLEVSSSGLYFVQVRDSNGCESISEMVEIIVFPQVPVPVIVQSNTQLLAPQAAQYQWFQDGNPIDGGIFSTFTPSSFGSYSVQITDANGCPAVSAPFDFNLELPVDQISEALTPNGDDVLDFFVIPFLEYFPENELIVFDRGGREVFRQKGYQNSWDGSSNNGEQLPTGVYYYSLTVNNQSDPVTGFIYLQR